MTDIISQEQLWLSQASLFNFEYNSTQLLQIALDKGFIRKVGEDQYEVNRNYPEPFEDDNYDQQNRRRSIQ